jgi:ATP adenylyltransferase/5',5'''-P-1,P-4-tetraphosphate phosphorylase II
MQMQGGCHYFQLWKNSGNLPFIKVFFMSEKQCPKILKHFLENIEAELLLSFAHCQISLFHETK